MESGEPNHSWFEPGLCHSRKLGDQFGGKVELAS